MEHIVQFAIGIDDDAVAKRIKESAFDEVVKQLANEARKELPKKGYYPPEVDWKSIIGEQVSKRVQAIIDERSDEIVEMAVKRVYKSISGRKAFREACKKMDIVFDGIGDDCHD